MEKEKVTSLEDKVEIISQGLGLVPQQPMTSLEESVFASLADADYYPEKEDADGKQLLNGPAVAHLALAKLPSSSGFLDPVTNPHYGAAADGRYYIDGEQTDVGPFSDASNLLDKHWRNRNVEPEAMQVYGTVSVLGADSIRISGTQVSGVDVWDTFGLIDSHRRWVLDGDFEITLDLDNFTKSTGSPTQLEFRFRARRWYGSDDDSVRCITVIRDTGSRNWRRDTTRDGSCCYDLWESSGGVPTGPYSLKIKRTGTTVECFYNTGGGWTTMGGSFSVSDSIADYPVYISLDLAGFQTGASGSLDISNFQVVSGSVGVRASWYREGAGTHRGALQSFPSAAFLAAPEASLEIISTAEVKLWIRFLQGSNNIFGGTPIRWIRWFPAGFFVTAQGTVGGSSGGMKVVSLAGDSCAEFNSNGQRGYKGWITHRNDGRGFWSYGTTVVLPGNSVLCVDGKVPDAIEAGTIYYLVAATNNGIGVIKTYSWIGFTNPQEYSVSNETTEMRWCEFDQSSGELFYADASKVYSIVQSGGTGWDTEKGLPGSPVRPGHYILARNGSDLFISRDEGIYKVAWPAGSWSLFYGPEGSDATHEILPEGRATMAMKANDGATDLLVVGTELKGLGQATLINLSTNQVYGRTKLRKFRDPSSMAA
jgi:hypothetical protein